MPAAHLPTRPDIDVLIRLKDRTDTLVGQFVSQVPPVLKHQDPLGGQRSGGGIKGRSEEQHTYQERKDYPRRIKVIGLHAHPAGRERLPSGNQTMNMSYPTLTQ
jgi:hypothetical protein